MKKRKGQMEIMGIAVIVILVSLGFMFFLKFSLSKDSEPLQKSFQKATIPTYFINAFLETSIGTSACDIEGKLKDLVSDCVQNSGCSGAYTNLPTNTIAMSQDALPYYVILQKDYDCIQCDQIDSKTYPTTSCGYLYKSLKDMFDKTIELQGKKYIFELENQNEQTILRITNGNCTITSKGSTQYKEFVLANSEKITLTIC